MERNKRIFVMNDFTDSGFVNSMWETKITNSKWLRPFHNFPGFFSQLVRAKILSAVRCLLGRLKKIFFKNNRKLLIKNVRCLTISSAKVFPRHVIRLWVMQCSRYFPFLVGTFISPHQRRKRNESSFVCTPQKKTVSRFKTNAFGFVNIVHWHPKFSLV